MNRAARAGFWASAAAVVSMCAAPALAAINASAEDTIEYRQKIMRTKDAQASAIGQILALMVPGDNIATHFEVLLLATRQAKSAFAPRVEGGESLPAVWDNWEDFSARLDRAEENIAKAVAEAREFGASGSIGEAAITAMMTCKDCHDTYRNKK